MHTGADDVHVGSEIRGLGQRPVICDAAVEVVRERGNETVLAEDGGIVAAESGRCRATKDGNRRGSKGERTVGAGGGGGEADHDLCGVVDGRDDCADGEIRVRDGHADHQTVGGVGTSEIHRRAIDGGGIAGGAGAVGIIGRCRAEGQRIRGGDGGIVRKGDVQAVRIDRRDGRANGDACPRDGLTACEHIVADHSTAEIVCGALHRPVRASERGPAAEDAVDVIGVRAGDVA